MSDRVICRACAGIGANERGEQCPDCCGSGDEGERLTAVRDAIGYLIETYVARQEAAERHQRAVRDLRDVLVESGLERPIFPAVVGGYVVTAEEMKFSIAKVAFH